MNLLVTTQMVDREDPILGFFHGWLVALSPHFSHIHVICLKEGTHALPENITVHSLGKEHGENRFLYVLRFFRYVWQLRNEYDAVYSHMNPHYIVLAGLFWKWRGVRMYLWRNHALMNIKTRVAAWFSERVFYTSPYACTRTFAHSVQMPVGIDTNIFHPEQNIIPEERSVLFLGRLSGVKRPELFVEATTLLADFSVHIYGDEPGGSTSYRRALEERAGGRITFHPSVPNYETPKIYRAFEIYVNLTPEGSMDKTVLEAAACGTLILVSNKSFEGFVPQECMLTSDSKEAVAAGIQKLARMSREQKNEIRIQLVQMVMEKHSLEALVTKLVKYISA